MSVIATNRASTHTRLQIPVFAPNEVARRRMLEHEHAGPIRADWLNLVFLHLEIDPGLLQQHVPFDLDLFDGRAFVSLVAFVMRRFRPRASGWFGSLLCTPLARHGFLNVRTYVKHRDEPGIFFLTEWVSNPFSVLFGPRTYGLPYRWGRLRYQHDIERGQWHGHVSTPNRVAALEYRAIDREMFDENGNGSCSRHHLSRAARIHEDGSVQGLAVRRKSDGERPRASNYRRNPLFSAPACSRIAQVSAFSRIAQSPASSHGAQVPVSSHVAQEGSLDAFLLERYTAYTRHRGVNRRFRIWHEPWQIIDIDATINCADLLDSIDPSLIGAQLIGGHASAGVRDVWVGLPRRVQ